MHRNQLPAGTAFHFNLPVYHQAFKQEFVVIRATIFFRTGNFHGAKYTSFAE